jgi:hypothetical protein
MHHTEIQAIRQRHGAFSASSTQPAAGSFPYESLCTPMPLAPHPVDTRFGYALLFTNHRDTESTEGTIFLPDRETAIGQEIAALRARSSNRVASCQRLHLG